LFIAAGALTLAAVGCREPPAACRDINHDLFERCGCPPPNEARQPHRALLWRQCYARTVGVSPDAMPGAAQSTSVRAATPPTPSNTSTPNNAPVGTGTTPIAGPPGGSPGGPDRGSPQTANSGVTSSGGSR